MDKCRNGNLYKNRIAVLATMHKKEQVIAPILKRELGMGLVVPEQFDTDAFGTFTNEIERAGDQLQAARKKIENAMLISDQIIGIASEGSFGSHPMVPFIPFNRELILFVDKEQDLEITGFAANSNTNYAKKMVGSFDEAYEFAVAHGFPEHGFIIKATTDTIQREEIEKGITCLEHLNHAVTKLLDSRSAICIETDMRAMYNPTRMKNIELATLDLVKKIQSICPECSTPGYEVVEYKKGLTCQYCGNPTDLILSHVLECKKCHHKDEVLYPNGKEYADPSRCNWCNP